MSIISYGGNPVRLVKIDDREYETQDKRFHVIWNDKRKGGALSCYRVLDRSTGRCLRAFTLATVRETIADMRTRRSPVNSAVR
jgi:hypothetical protein